MASGTLYTYPDNFRAYKVLVAAQYGGGNVKVAPGFVFGTTNKTPEFLKKFPLGKVPAFETSDNQYLTESNAIAYYVSSDQLRGGNAVEKAQVVQWLSYADNEVLPVVSTWVFPYMGMLNFDKKVVNGAKNDMTELLNKLNSYLLTKTYLVGERVTLADVVMACTLLNAYQHVFDPTYRAAFKNVNRWFLTVVNQPKVKAVLGNVKLCEKEPEVPAGPKAEKQGKKEKEQKPKEEKPKQKEAAPPADDLDETELALRAEPKSKDPFEPYLQTKSTFVLDEFKRCYSNEEVTVSIPFFWNHFDKENYSIWFGEYKYNEELKKVFMSCNLVTGMFQRLGKMCKHAFASVCVFGKDDDNSISGVWVWRGPGLAFELSPDLQVDYESYTWTKLDPDNADHKATIDNYLAWTGKDKQGRPFNQGKVFK
ncbi:elongation factor 1-gamma [Cimex lectularius]|uniref:Elongation factor 1-gamma n=1 Tax=Cimex lectularius TaxID=79782 RepID=A0A8I6REU1_CIMLE|nr:elongation factor 1-gamma [Cimex lectularius]